MSDLDDATDSDPTRPTDGSAVDAVARLSALNQRAPTSIFARREAVAPTPAAPDSPVIAAEVVESPFAATPEPTPPGPQPEPPTAGPRPALGRLTRVGAADLWPDDASMARWLATQPEVLGEALGAELARVAAVDPNRLQGSAPDGSPFHAVCEVGASSADALASLLAVASLQEGGSVAWISGEPDDTHGATLSWLNRTTATRFFLVRVAGVRIGESAAAPTLETVVRPPRAETTDPSPASPPITPSPGRRADDHGVDG